MVVSCCVNGCSQRYKPGISFYRFPTDMSRKNMWLRSIKRGKFGDENTAWQPSDHDRVCGRHFIKGKSDDPLDPDYTPTVNMGNPYTIKKANMSAKKRFDRMVLRESRKQLFQSPQGTNKENSLIDEYASDCWAEVAEALLDLSACSPNVMTPIKPIDIHDSCLKKITELSTKHENALKEVGRLQEENEQLKKHVNMLQFTDKFLEHVDDNKRDSVTTFFTGLPGYAEFMWMVTFTTCILPKSKLLSPGSVLLNILMKLRLNLQNQDIALRFGVSATHVGQNS